MILIDAHNIWFYGEITHFSLLIPTPDFQRFYFNRTFCANFGLLFYGDVPMMRRRLPWLDSNWPLRIGKKHFHARIQRGERGLDPPLIFEIVGFEMVELCRTHPGQKLDPVRPLPTRENLMDPHLHLIPFLSLFFSFYPSFLFSF